MTRKCSRNEHTPKEIYFFSCVRFSRVFITSYIVGSLRGKRMLQIARQREAFSCNSLSVTLRRQIFPPLVSVPWRKRLNYRWYYCSIGMRIVGSTILAWFDQLVDQIVVPLQIFPSLAREAAAAAPGVV